MHDSFPARSLADTENLFKEIMARHKDAMIKLSYVQLQNIEWAEIAVINIFVVVYQRLPHYPGVEKEKAWICRIAVEEWRHLLRRKAMRMKPLCRTKRR